MLVLVSDTTPDAAAAHAEVFRRMAPSERSLIAARLSVAVRTTTLAGIRKRHPEYSDEHARLALFRILVGDELFARAWPQVPLLPP
jgi:hypothetical protein